MSCPLPTRRCYPGALRVLHRHETRAAALAADGRTPSPERVATPDFGGPGYVVALQGDMVVHRAGPLTEPSERISMVTGYIALDTSVDGQSRTADLIIVDAQVENGLKALPAVALEGVRACGKTSTGREHARSEVMFGSNPSARLAAQVDPAELLAGPEPRLLDEWQLAPEIWNQVRAAGDDGRRRGRFILTGSASPADEITRHTGTGRITRHTGTGRITRHTGTGRITRHTGTGRITRHTGTGRITRHTGTGRITRHTGTGRITRHTGTGRITRHTGTGRITRHTGTGRITRIQMRPMSLFESELSSGEVSMADLFSGHSGFVVEPTLGLRDVVEAACRGGWPACIDMDLASAQDYAASYLQEVCRADIPQLDGPARDPLGVTRLLRSLARHVATEASERTLAADTGGERHLDGRTVGAYLDALRRLFVVEDVPAWSVELRSRAHLRRAAKRHLVDPSPAIAALGASPDRLMQDLPAFGLLFESLAVRDLRIYAQANRGRIAHYCDDWPFTVISVQLMQANRGRIAHYRDSNGLEVDAIIERGDGAWIALEIKLGGEVAIDNAAKSLLKLRDTVEDRQVGAPSNLVVLTATGYGYRRDDGILVMPLTTLGP